MNSALQAARQLRQSRYTKRITVLSEAEFEYVLSSSELNDGQKILWLCLANLTKYDETLTISLTHSNLSQKLNISPYKVGRGIKELRDKGFLCVQFNEAVQSNVYTLIFPEQGLDFVDSQPDRRTKKTFTSCNQEQEKFPKLITENKEKQKVIPGSSFARGGGANLQPTPYINNNIKKHNIYVEDEFSSSCKQDVDLTSPDHQHYVLLDQYDDYVKKIHTENPKISIRDLNRLVGEKFSHEQMMLVLDATRRRDEVEAMKACQEHKLVLAEKKPQSSIRDFVSPKERLGKPKQLETFSFEGIVYKLEKNVLPVLRSKMSLFQKENSFKGQAANRERKELMKELLYYVSCSSKSKLSQVHRLNSAIYMMKNGDWEVPHAIKNQQIRQREDDWQSQKHNEIKHSKGSLARLGLTH